MKIKVLIVGCGNMGASHALSYHHHENFEIVGLISRGPSKEKLQNKLKHPYPLFDDFYEALKISRPNAVCISTYPETHEAYTIAAMQAGAHVFLEKPIADSVKGAENVAKIAKETGKKLVVGYILRHHPSWIKFIELSKSLGKPLVMRMNLNQQSHGYMWDVHKNLMKSLSPIVDCGVHYIDVMCQMTQSKPIKVAAIGAKLTNEIPEDNYNYGQLQIHFEDGSVGWYEAGWGPMMSQTAFFIKDVIGPKGSVSIVAKNAGSEGKSDSIDDHTKTESLRFHSSAIDKDNNFLLEDEWIDLKDEPNHQELCDREQAYFYKAISEDIDLTEHVNDAVNSLKIAFACDESIKFGKFIEL
ncbi:MAG: hypothetical protein RIR51_1832 [Bacteroidota bacterium]|jgi:predicted dehydrogenase